MSGNLSVYVIAYNDEPNMRACLESVAGWGDELIVVDSHSTDQTAAISREFTDKVYQVIFRVRELRNEAVALTTHEWVFSLDSDERMTPELREEIRLVLRERTGGGCLFRSEKELFFRPVDQTLRLVSRLSSAAVVSKGAVPLSRTNLSMRVLIVMGRSGFSRVPRCSIPFETSITMWRSRIATRT